MENEKEYWDSVFSELSNLKDDDIEAITHTKFKDRWIAKLAKMTTTNRIILIRKIIKKYNSKEYRDRYFSRYLEPTECLYNIIAEYAHKYGTRIFVRNEKNYGIAYHFDCFTVLSHEAYAVFYEIIENYTEMVPINNKIFVDEMAFYTEGIVYSNNPEYYMDKVNELMIEFKNSNNYNSNNTNN